MVIVKNLVSKINKLNKYIGLLGEDAPLTVSIDIAEDIRNLLYDYRGSYS